MATRRDAMLFHGLDSVQQRRELAQVLQQLGIEMRVRHGALLFRSSGTAVEHSPIG